MLPAASPGQVQGGQGEPSSGHAHAHAVAVTVPLQTVPSGVYWQQSPLESWNSPGPHAYPQVELLPVLPIVQSG